MFFPDLLEHLLVLSEIIFHLYFSCISTQNALVSFFSELIKGSVKTNSSYFENNLCENNTYVEQNYIFHSLSKFILLKGLLLPHCQIIPFWTKRKFIYKISFLNINNSLLQTNLRLFLCRIRSSRGLFSGTGSFILQVLWQLPPSQLESGNRKKKKRRKKHKKLC